MRTLVRHDPEFLKEAAGALLDVLDSGREALAPARVPQADDPLPTSLITPRMLCQATWLERVRPILFAKEEEEEEEDPA